MSPLLPVFILFLIKGLILFGIFLLSALAWLGVAQRVVKDADANILICGIALILGPISLSWFLTALLHLAPNMPRVAYIFGPLVPLLIIGLVWRVRGLNVFNRAVFAFWRQPGLRIGHVFIVCIAILLVAFGLGGLVILGAVIPMHGNDALEYSRLAQILAETRNGHIYPITDPETAAGFMAPWSHPMGYINLLTYSYFLQGDLEVSGISRFVAPYFAFAQTVLMIGFAGYKRKISGWLAALFLLASPLYYALVVQCHIDPTRIAAFTAAIVCIWLLSRTPGIGMAIVTGIACGMSMFTHSIGIVTLPLAIPAYILLARKGRLIRHGYSLAIVCLLSVSLVAHRYIINLHEFGGFISDTVKVWEMPELAVEHARNVTRFMDGPMDSVVYGALAGFSSPELFGWFYYVFAFAILVWLFSTFCYWRNPFRLLRQQTWRENSDPGDIALLIAGGYFAVMFISLLLGTNIAVKNSRYVLTLQPFILVFAVRLLAARLFDDGRHQENTPPHITPRREG